MLNVIGACAYIVVASLTYGTVFNDTYNPRPDCGARPDSVAHAEQYEIWYDCQFGDHTDAFEAGLPAAYAAAFWPLYWAGRIGIAVTK